MSKNLEKKYGQSPPIIKKIDSDRAVDLIAKIKEQKTTDLVSCSFLVLKVSRALEKHLRGDKHDRKQILARSRGKDVYLLNFCEIDKKYNLALVAENLCKDESSKEYLSYICQHDLLDVLERSDGGCFHVPQDNLHYQTPSGFHTKCFFRLADALHSYSALERISFWIQSYLLDKSAVIIDNGSLSSIILHAQKNIDKDLAFDCIPQHISTNFELSRNFAAKLIDSLPVGSSKVLVVVSVNASGNLSRGFVDMCADLAPSILFETLSIFQLPCNFTVHQTNITLCHLNKQALQFYEEEKCPYCHSDEETRVIDPRYYYPKPDDAQKMLKLPMKYLKRGGDEDVRETLDALGSSSRCLFVHRDDPNDGENPRHHAFYIDVLELIDQQEFLSKFEQRLIQIEEDARVIPDVVIAPTHKSAEALAGIVKKKWNCTIVFCDDLIHASVDEVVKIESASHVCFMDDVIVTGSRLTGFNRVLRETIRPSQVVYVSYIVAVCRLQSKGEFTQLSSSLTSMHAWKAKIYFAFNLYLPNWSETDCPWCKEVYVWESANAPFDPPSYWSDRQEQLASKRGINKNVFPRFPEVNELTAGESSPMVNAGSSEISTLFNMTVAVQMLRHEVVASERLFKSFSYNNALDGSESGVFDRYSEPLFQACLLRCVKPVEWSSDVVGSGIEFLVGKMNDKSTHILLIEILVFLRRYNYKYSNKDELLKVMKWYLADNDPIMDVIDGL